MLKRMGMHIPHTKENLLRKWKTVRSITFTDCIPLSKLPLQGGMLSSSLSGWLAPIAKLGRATSFFRGGSPRNQPLSASTSQQAEDGPQGDAHAFSSQQAQIGADRAAGLVKAKQKENLPLQLANW